MQTAEITSTVLSQVMSRRVAPFKLLVLTPGKIDQSIYETLARDHSRTRRGAGRDLRRCARAIRRRWSRRGPCSAACSWTRGATTGPRGRFMINKKLSIDAPASAKTLRSEDIVAVIRHLLR